MARRSIQRRIYPDCWSFPGGHLESGETEEQALVRELVEEIGVTPTEFHKLRSIIHQPEARTEIVFHIFAVTDWSGQPEIRNHEHTQLRWASLSRAAEFDPLALQEYEALLLSLKSAPTT